MTTPYTVVTITHVDSEGRYIAGDYTRWGEIDEQAVFLFWLRDQGLAFVAKMKKDQEEQDNG